MNPMQTMCPTHPLKRQLASISGVQKEESQRVNRMPRWGPVSIPLVLQLIFIDMLILTFILLTTTHQCHLCLLLFLAHASMYIQILICRFGGLVTFRNKFSNSSTVTVNTVLQCWLRLHSCLRNCCSGTRTAKRERDQEPTLKTTNTRLRLNTSLKHYIKHITYCTLTERTHDS